MSRYASCAVSKVMCRIAVGMAGCLVVGTACSVRPQGVPEGAIARVGERVFEARDLDALTAQLEGYGQLRFSQEGGERALLGALITRELLAQTAEDEGYRDDARVRWALIEEVASGQLLAEMERVVPYEVVAGDVERLRREYEADLDAFATPERRAFAGVLVDSVEAGSQLLIALRAGEVELEALGEMVRTREQIRDDATLPGFSVVLFTDGLSPGALLPYPVIIGTKVYVGRLESRTRAQPKDLADPAVQEKLVNVLRGRLVAGAQNEYRRALAEQIPVDLNPQP